MYALKTLAHARGLVRRALVASTLLLAAAGVGIPAAASIINIDATKSPPNGTSLTLDPGRYRIEWIGRADGGEYDAWFTGSECTRAPAPDIGCNPNTGWSVSFAAILGPGSVDVFFVTPSFRASAAQALTNAQGAASINHVRRTFPPGTLQTLDPIPQPWELDLDDTTQLQLFTPSAQVANPTLVTGGVSLRLTNLSVPAPAIGGLVLVALAGMGVAQRRHVRS